MSDHEDSGDTESGYTPPDVWDPETRSGGEFADINRPTAGPRYEEELPVGDHALQLYSLATPNGQKVTIMLEELLEAGIEEAEYDAWPIDISEGEQFSSGFVDVNPNSKIPAMVDRSQDPDQRVFESGSILMYLAEKFGEFLPDDPAGRTETRSWLFWQVGSAPYVGGGFGHFYNYAPEKLKYPIDRYTMETKRQLDVLDRRLDDHTYLAGDSYTVADMASWPWYGEIVRGEVYDAAEFLAVDEYPNVQRWADAIAERPAVQRGQKVNRAWGDESEQVPERHDSSDFDS
jgi:GST-like protein